MPLELGGDPNDPANLWLEPNDRPGATSTTNAKDGLENHLRQLVCAGRLPLAVAQQAIAADWVAALLRYGPVAERARTAHETCLTSGPSVYKTARVHGHGT